MSLEYKSKMLIGWNVFCFAACADWAIESFSHGKNLTGIYLSVLGVLNAAMAMRNWYMMKKIQFFEKGVK